MRIIGGIVAGIVAAMATIMAVEMIGHLLYPMPAEVDVRNLPVRAQLFVLAGWFLGALTGGSVAALISRRTWTAWLIAGLVALGGLVVIFWIPHPELMQVASMVAPLLGGLLAAHVVPRRAARSREGVAG